MLAQAAAILVVAAVVAGMVGLAGEDARPVALDATQQARDFIAGPPVDPARRPGTCRPVGAAGPGEWRAHVELFVDGQAVVIPAGVGVGGSRVEAGRVLAGSCGGAIRTLDPTGIVQVDPGRDGATPRLGGLFAAWGAHLGPRRLLDTHGTVRAWSNGRPWHGDVRRVPLRRHAQVVVEVGAVVPPHPSYPFGVDPSS